MVFLPERKDNDIPRELDTDLLATIAPFLQALNTNSPDNREPSPDDEATPAPDNTTSQ